jgi:hypothetical protein
LRGRQRYSYSENSILWNPKFHYRFHKTSPMVLLLRQSNKVHSTLPCLYEICLNAIHPPTLCSSSGLLLSVFRKNNIYLFLFSVRTTCETHLILVELIILITLGKGYKSHSSTLCSVLHPPITHPSSVQIFSSALCYETPSVYVPPLISEIKLIPIQNSRQNYIQLTSSSQNSLKTVALSILFGKLQNI